MSFIDYIEEHCSAHPVSGGSQLLLDEDCPFCGGHGKIYVDQKKGIGICFRCSEGFGAVKFVSAREGVSKAKAIKLLGGSEDRYERIEEEEEAPSPDAPWYPPCVPLDGPGAAYMAERGFDGEFCRGLGLMLCNQNVKTPGPDGKVYWTSGRVIIFIRDQAGQIISWIGRDITGKSKIKYLFQPGFKAADHLYNIESVKHGGPLIVAEGVMDVWGWIRAGFTNVVATFGKKISKAQVAMISAMAPRAIYIAWDGDAMWEKCRFAEEYGHIFNVKIVRMGEEDADELDSGRLRDLYDGATGYSWEDKIISGLA